MYWNCATLLYLLTSYEVEEISLNINRDVPTVISGTSQSAIDGHKAIFLIKNGLNCFNVTTL